MSGIKTVWRGAASGMVVLCVFVLGLNVAQAVPKKTTEQIKQVCDKAEQRYQKMFGKP
ncbi:MAG: hypothetical protein GY927_21260, partial [bacterium]|nr:hypothetical protein [bacterium]